MKSLLLFALFLSVCSFLTKAQTNGDIQLVNNDNSTSGGRVEIFINNKWGTVCSDGFGRTEANVICNQLGYANALLYGNSKALGYSYGSESQPIVMDDVSCSEGTKHILSCQYNSISNCNHFEDIAIKCNSMPLWAVAPYNGMIRLTGGDYSSQGLLEVYCNGEWGTVCDDLFETNEATTACRQLGYTHSLNGRIAGLISSNNSQPIWLDDVQCTDDMICINSCKKCPSVQNHDCTHKEDVSIRCTYQGQYTGSFKSCQADTGRSAVTSGVIVAIVITCILMLCCCLGLVFVLVTSILIARKKKKVSTTTEETSLDDMSSINKSTQLFTPQATASCHTYEEPQLPLYDTIPDNYRNTVVYDQQPTLFNGEDRPIYIQPPATTPSSEHPPPFPSS